MQINVRPVLVIDLCRESGTTADVLVIQYLCSKLHCDRCEMDTTSCALRSFKKEVVVLLYPSYNSAVPD